MSKAKRLEALEALYDALRGEIDLSNALVRDLDMKVTDLIQKVCFDHANEIFDLAQFIKELRQERRDAQIARDYRESLDHCADVRDRAIKERDAALFERDQAIKERNALHARLGYVHENNAKEFCNVPA